ncbi:NAD(P)/FAD-dependent oxidoreductase, partial [Candidatus Uhrbacteria bacterium]|nr:NAD(P)/FAD-dependent oxidoreductase [Candidatus Uhrbacteria bacterium]
MKYQYDLLVIGSGSSGFTAATSAKGQGRKIGIIEEDRLWGGECPNWACVPTKAILKSAKVFRDVQDSEQYGVVAKGASIDFSAVLSRRNKIVATIGGKRIEESASKLGIDTIKGRATFLDDHTVHVGDKTYTSDKFVIATGSGTFVPPIQGLDKVDWLDFKRIMGLGKLPKSLIVIGGGPVGCEYAFAFATFGTKVTLLQSALRVLNREDVDISQVAHDSLVLSGVAVHVGSEVLSVDQSGEGKVVTVKIGKDIVKMNAEHIFLATGKRSNTSGMGLKAAGVKLDDRGSVIVNTTL